MVHGQIRCDQLMIDRRRYIALGNVHCVFMKSVPVAYILFR